MAPSGISLNKPAAITIVVLVAGGIILYRWGWSSHAPDIQSDKEDSGNDQAAGASHQSQDNKVLDVGKLATLPAVKDEDLLAFTVNKVNINVEVKGKTLSIFSQQTSPKVKAKLTVLLLHGAAFTSNNWVSIKTLQLLASWGFRAVAVDLPGSGQSEDVSLDRELREEFMVALVKSLGTIPVIVSPSMSGGYSLPYLFKDPQLSTQRAVAFVPVAPAGTGAFTKSYPDSQLPTLIVHGALDDSFGAESQKNLKALPKSQIVSIPKAKHACYMDNPSAFHTALHHFLVSLQ